MKIYPARINLRTILLAGTALLLVGMQLSALYPGVTTPLESFDFAARDAMMRLRGTRATSGNVVIVAIDDFSFKWNELQWPWPRAYLAKIVEQINQGGASVVGLDIFLFEPAGDIGGDQALAKALGSADASVSVMQIYADPEKNTQTLQLPLAIYRTPLDAL